MSVRAEGRASSVSGACPNLTFTVGGRAVRTNGGTQFVRNCERFATTSLWMSTARRSPGGEILDARLQTRKQTDVFEVPDNCTCERRFRQRRHEGAVDLRVIHG